MANPLLDGFITFVTNPTFGLPFVVLTGALVVWLLWEPAVPVFRSATRQTFRPSDGDSLSRSYFALRNRQYSRLVLEAQWRLDAALKRRYRFELRTLPLTGDGGLPTGRLADLRRLRRRLVSLYSSSLRWVPAAGGEGWFAQWKARRDGRRRARLERFLRECDYLSRTVETGG